MKRLFLIDGSALIHRAFHSFSGRSQLSSRGRDVSMVYGFLNTVVMVLRREKPDYILFTFDTAAPTFRHKMYDLYKANRPPMDPLMRDQIPLLYELIDLLRLPRLEMEGYEADDIIGTLSKRGAEAGLEVIIVSGDKDFYQLVNEQVKVYTLDRTGQANIYDPLGVEEKFGVPPDKVIDVLALMGDTADNVPGVPKVGEKTAVDLIKRFGDFDTVLASADKVSQPKLKENLVLYADQARLSRELVIIDTNVPMEIQPLGLTFGPLNNQQARAKLLDLEFRSILNQLDQLEPESLVFDLPTLVKDEPKQKRDYRIVANPQELDEMISRLTTAKLLALDTETTSLDAMLGELVGLSFAVRENDSVVAYYVTVNHFTDIPAQYVQPEPPYLRPACSRNTAYILSRIAPLLANPSIPKCGQNLKYDLLVLSCYGVSVEGVVCDTLLASQILDSGARQHNLDFLSETHLGVRKIPTSHLIGSGSKQITMDQVALEEIAEYAAEDADCALRLAELFMPRIAGEGYSKLMAEQELPLLPLLVKIERTGFALDLELLKSMSVEFQTEMDKILIEVQETVGFPFNLNSTQQLADILYNRIGLPVGRKTKFGYSTDNDELERLAALHTLPRQILRNRHLAKLKSTYLDALAGLIHPITGRVHTSYTQTMTATGRLSSSDPNLQNIPIRTEDGGRIRRAFIAGEPGWKIISADYSQIELRIMAHLSSDSRMIEAFKGGEDIHRATASWMFDIPAGLITGDMRRQAKEVNFGVLYGMGEFGLADRLGISRKRAKEFIEQYFANFPSVKGYIEEIHNNAREKGYVETMMGRRRPIPEINASNFNIRQNALRVATNTPIQGSAADLMKGAMLAVDRMMTAKGYKARMLLQVHDELVFEAPPDEVKPLTESLRQVMSSVWKLKVPLEVGIGVGDNWLDAHD